jgi:hypothetical protein
MQFEKLNIDLSNIYSEIVTKHDLQKSYALVLSKSAYVAFRTVFLKEINAGSVSEINRLMKTDYFDNLDNDLFEQLKYEFAVELCHKTTISALLGDHIANKYMPLLIKAIAKELYGHCTEKLFEYLGLDLHYNKVAHHREDLLKDAKQEFYQSFNLLRVA